MRQPSSLSDCCTARATAWSGKPRQKKDDPQKRLCVYMRVDPDLVGKRAVGERIIKRKRLFVMRSG